MTSVLMEPSSIEKILEIDSHIGENALYTVQSVVWHGMMLVQLGCLFAVTLYANLDRFIQDTVLCKSVVHREE